MSSLEKNKEIDLPALIRLIWDGKFLILFSLFTALLLALIYLNFTETKFQANVYVNVNVVNSLTSENTLQKKLEAMLKSKELFRQFATENNPATLKFTDIVPITTIEGQIFSLEDKKSIFSLKGSVVEIYSNDSSVIADIKNFLDFSNEKLTNQIVDEAKSIILHLKNSTAVKFDFETIELLLHADEILNYASSGKLVLSYSLPTKPVKKSPRSSFIIILSVFSCGLLTTSILVLREMMSTNKYNTK